MIEDIKRLTELYLHSNGLLPEDKSWSDFHNELIQSAPLETVKLLADKNPKDKCKYALFVNVDTKTKTCEVEDYIEIGAVSDWSSHLFWQGSGGRKSDKSRSTSHKIFDSKSKFSVESLIEPLQTILNDYCQIQEGKGKNKEYKETGPLFWDASKKGERQWLKSIIDILNDNKDETNKIVKGREKMQGKFPSLKQGESVFVGLTIDGEPLGEYELFRRYLSFVRTRKGVQKGPDKFKQKFASDVVKEFISICPSCHTEKPLLNQWWEPAELSFYQMTYESFSSYSQSSAAYNLCQSCADLLFIFKQQLLKTLTPKLAGNECLILPSIKLIPSDHNEKRRLFENLKGLWSSSISVVPSTEKRLLYRLGQLPSYATVSFIFGNYITVGKSQDVKRLDELNIIFPDVLPSRLSQIAKAIKETNEQLYEMWFLTGRDWQCTWNVRDDFYLLYQLFYPAWEEKQRDKSRRRPEVERYLRTIFYGYGISYNEITTDCYPNLLSAINKSRNASDDDNKAKYARDNYMGNLLSLLVLLDNLKVLENKNMEVNIMAEEMQFEFKAMPELGKLVKMHPLFRDSQYLAPFFVGCLFSYAENLQKDSSRLAAYNWLGTMALTYDDILNDIYHKVLNYISNKEKIISSPRLQELTKAIAHYDRGRCDNDRVALTAFCHGWALGRDFI